MARNIVKTRDYSFRGVKREGMSYKAKATIVFVVCLVLTLQATAQYIAYTFENHPVLGWSFPMVGYRVYPFYRAAYWLYILMSTYEESRSSVAAMSAFVFSTGLIISACAARHCYLNGKSESLESLHGSAHWATLKEIQDAGLLDEDGEPFSEGVVVGGIQVGKEVKMMRHSGREHVLCYAPTRSGKGISLVLPTLLDGWKQSVFVLDIKCENFSLSAGYRAKELGQKILKLDFTDPDAISDGTSATFNPLEEVHLDFTFEPGKRLPDPNNPEEEIFKLVPSGTNSETANIQQIVAIIVDPNGKGLADHWEKTASSFMLGAVTHLLYKFRMERRGVPGISDVLTELSKPGIPWRQVVEHWQEYPHLGYDEKIMPNGERAIIPIVHPIVAQEAQSILNKPDEEAGSVLSTVISNMGLFRDPVVARNTSKSSFRIRDLMNHEDPVSCYLVINPNDQLRLMPLSRLVLTQIIFTLAAKMDFKDGKSAETYKHRLLLMLDEFPSLGKMDLFERALGFIGGYGVKSYIMVQGLPQLFKAYSKDESIRVGCHIQVAFAPNDLETCEYLSKSTGQATILKENFSESFQEGKLFGGKSRQTSLQEVQRPLMTPDECRRLPGLRKNSSGDVVDAGNMLIFPAGFSAIYGTQTLYFQNPEMDRRSKILPPDKSDNLVEIIF
ncbi:MAG: type IV secretory system conjugative DNA transfer family protein [Synergistaceae bacterium]|jgi:type IV secretion system protein VirD4|nr:type IV secretory system conjugative DNA transfer family protein [Synergistaceae bacterium]